MFWSAQTSSRRATRWILVAFTALCFTLPFILFYPGRPHLSKGWFLEVLHWQRPSPPKDDGPSWKFYQWKPDPSPFHPVSFDNAQNKSIDELCAAFPSHVLERIQPVLKTGHAVVDARLPAHFQGVSACLRNVLIFSDLKEKFQDHTIWDVIGDIPTDLPHAGGISPADQLVDYFALQELSSNNTLDSADLSKLHGWKTDKFKWLTGISRAWRMRANRDWYVFFEDDTYIVWDNLFRMLGHFNPDAPWYFGSPTPDRLPSQSWPNPTKASEHEKKMSFAYGGVGVVISRAAMRKLIHEDWDWDTGEYLGPKLTERWWEHEVLTNCCGDSILGWALFNEGVELSGLWPMFSPTPARNIPFSDVFWCKPILAMHKASEEQMTGMWRWEWEQRRPDRPLLYRDLAISYFDFTNLTTLSNWDNGGRSTFRAPDNNPHYTHDPHASFSACQTACEAMPNCKQYSYHLRICKTANTFHYGEAREPEMGDVSEEESKMQWEEEDLVFRAGWAKERIVKWMDERPCEKVEWVKPSLERIF